MTANHLCTTSQSLLTPAPTVSTTTKKKLIDTLESSELHPQESSVAGYQLTKPSQDTRHSAYVLCDLYQLNIPRQSA